MAKKDVIQKGDLVQITFLDHCENSNDALEFIIWGRIDRITRTAYIIASWVYNDPVEQAKDTNTDNENYYVIVRKAITNIKKLK